MNRVNHANPRSPLIRFLAVAIALLALMAQAAWPAYAKTVLPQKPDPPRLMSDTAGMLGSSASGEIEDQLVSFWRDTGVQFAVVTVPGLDGDAIEDYSVRLFEAWGIGEEGKDNGLLLLIAAEERELKFETGYGLEGELPDAFLGKVIDKALVPQFRAGDPAAGIEAAIEMVADRLMGRSGEGPGDEESSGERAETLAMIVFFVIVVAILLVAQALRGRGGRGGRGTGGGGRTGTWRTPTSWPKSTGGWGGSSGGRSGGSSSGGFGGFGGGRSGGGGAKGGW